MALSKLTPFGPIFKLKRDVDSDRIPKYCGLCLRHDSINGVELIDSHIFPKAVLELAHPSGIYDFKGRQIRKAQSMLKAQHYHLCKKTKKLYNMVDCEVGCLQRGEDAFLHVCRDYMKDRYSRVHLSYNEHLYKGVASIAYRALLDYNLRDHGFESFMYVAVTFLYHLRRATYTGLQASECGVHVFVSAAGLSALETQAHSAIQNDFLFHDASCLVANLQVSNGERYFYVLVRFLGLHFIVVPSEVVRLLTHSYLQTGDPSMRMWQEIKSHQGEIVLERAQDRVTHYLIMIIIKSWETSKTNEILSVHGTKSYRYSGKMRSVDIVLDAGNFFCRLPHGVTFNYITGERCLKGLLDAKKVYEQVDDDEVITELYDLGRKRSKKTQWLLVVDKPPTKKSLRYILSWYITLNQASNIECEPAVNEDRPGLYDQYSLIMENINRDPYLRILRSSANDI